MSPRRLIDPLETTGPAATAADTATAADAATDTADTTTTDTATADTATDTRRRRLSWPESAKRVVGGLRGRRWGMAVTAATATVLLAAGVATSTAVLVSHTAEQRADVRSAQVLDFVQAFMSFYLSPDPFQANQYADRVQSQATGPFASYYQEVKNQVVLVVGMGTQTSGTVITKAIEQWHDDGSATALVVVRIARAAPDGRTATTLQERYAVTAVEEGQEWKISDVTSVF